MDWGFTAVPAISVVCYLAAQTLKATPLDVRWLPVLCGFLGGLLGVLSVALAPGLLSEDFLAAAAQGIVSGLAATGAHQAVKQLGGRD